LIIKELYEQYGSLIIKRDILDDQIHTIKLEITKKLSEPKVVQDTYKEINDNKN